MPTEPTVQSIQMGPCVEAHFKLANRTWIYCQVKGDMDYEITVQSLINKGLCGRKRHITLSQTARAIVNDVTIILASTQKLSAAQIKKGFKRIEEEINRVVEYDE